ALRTVIISNALKVPESARTETAARTNDISVPLIQNRSRPSLSAALRLASGVLAASADNGAPRSLAFAELRVAIRPPQVATERCQRDDVNCVWMTWPKLFGACVFLAAPAGLHRIFAARTMRIAARRRDGAAEVIPVGGAQVLQPVDHFESVETVAVHAAMHRLNLQERIVRVERNRHVRARQLEIDEQRTEPAVGLDDALVALIARAVREVGGRTNQQTPAWR